MAPQSWGPDERADLQEARGVITSELLTVQGSKAADSCLCEAVTANAMTGSLD